MNIKILDSFLREHLKTKATPQELAEKMSLSSLSVEKIEKYNNDFVYEMEITTNRPDLFSVLGIAREAAAVLPQYGFDAEFIPLKLSKNKFNINSKFPIEIINDEKLVNRICAVVMEVEIKNSPEYIRERLETSDIRSLNNVIDVTKYITRLIGHPAHVFDYDRLNTKKLSIREARGGEKITTLDGKNYVLNGREIVAVNDKENIVDLLGIMGLENSVVTQKTKKILYFIDNNEPHHIRNASMNLAIRTEAATINEKGIDPELSMDALLYGIKLFEKIANGKQISEILDIYPNKPKEKTIEVSFEKIDKILGISIKPEKIAKYLEDLGFKTTLDKNNIKVSVPSFRTNDVGIEEDIIEEIARLYGYHNLPSILPPIEESEVSKPIVDEFYWEKRVKNALKYWGFTETYTYSFVGESMYEGPIDEAVEINNPLTEDMVYMRNSLIPSLLNVVSENKSAENLMIFEIANVYLKKTNDLPNEVLTLSGVLKKKNASFYEVKGIIEQLLQDLGIKNISFKKSEKAGIGAALYINKDYLGEVEVLDTNIIDFELNFQTILKHVTLKKEYKPFAKFPPIIEDLSVVTEPDIKTKDLVENIKSHSNLIVDVSLTDTYLSTRTFRIIYQDPEKNLTNEDVSKIRNKIISSLEKDFKATIR
jgi:phenylalanyl-tRNA synthetase beta chain